MEKQKNIPSLRFPEYNINWEIKKLSELSENGFSNGAFNDPKKVGSGFRIINVKDMYVDGTINVDNLTKVALDEKEFLKNRVEWGDIFFTRSSLVKEGIAHSNVNLNYFDDLTFDGHLIRMRPIKQFHSPIFLYYNFSTINARLQFIKRGKTTTMTTIGQEDIASVEIILPNLQEQNKIASFLTKVDEKLTALKKKKELLEQYKKGVMQQIFSQELRFKDDDGNDYPEWEEKDLGTFSKITTGSSNREDSNLDGEYTFFDRSQDIRSSNRYLFDAEAIIVPGEGQEFIPKFFVGKFDLHQRTYAIMDFGINIGKYLFYFISYNSNHLNSHAVGSTVKSLRLPMFEKMPIKLPCIKEQVKIADFISTIDNKISYCQSQIEKAEVWKKGLLQQMFC